MSTSSMLALRRRLADAATDGYAELAETWIAATVRRSRTLRDRAVAPQQLTARGQAILAALGESVQMGEDLVVGGPELREPLRLLSFTAGWLAGLAVPASVVISLCHGLDAVLGAVPPPWMEGFEIAAVDAYVSSYRQIAESRHSDVLERSQVVCLVGDALPCLFLVGDPGNDLITAAISRLVSTAAVYNGSAVIVDITGLDAPERRLAHALSLLAAQQHRLPVLLSGIPQPLTATLETHFRSLGVACYGSLHLAITAALRNR